MKDFQGSQLHKYMHTVEHKKYKRLFKDPCQSNGKY